MTVTDVSSAERRRLNEAGNGGPDWRRWGPYLSDRQWGTVREDYSPSGDAWGYLPHDCALLNLYVAYGDGLTVECPTGSGVQMTLFEIAQEISQRLTRLFLPDDNGRRPCHGGQQIFATEHWRDVITFSEYFHGDNGARPRCLAPNRVDRAHRGLPATVRRTDRSGSARPRKSRRVREVAGKAGLKP